MNLAPRRLHRTLQPGFGGTPHSSVLLHMKAHLFSPTRGAIISMHTSRFHLELQMREHKRHTEPDPVHRRDGGELSIRRPFSRYPGVYLRSGELPDPTKAEADREGSGSIVSPIDRPR